MSLPRLLPLLGVFLISCSELPPSPQPDPAPPGPEDDSAVELPAEASEGWWASVQASLVAGWFPTVLAATRFQEPDGAAASRARTHTRRLRTTSWTGKTPRAKSGGRSSANARTATMPIVEYTRVERNPPPVKTVSGSVMPNMASISGG